MTYADGSPGPISDGPVWYKLTRKGMPPTTLFRDVSFVVLPPSPPSSPPLPPLPPGLPPSPPPWDCVDVTIRQETRYPSFLGCSPTYGCGATPLPFG